METTEKRIAGILLDIGAVFLRPDQPFTWASGIQSPIYCDNRLSLSDVPVRETVEQGLAALVRQYYPNCGALYGTATAGIAHAAIAAHLLGLPMGYVRSGSKDHGRGGKIEGRAEAGTLGVVVEDLISTAGSAIAAAETLREAGCVVPGMVSIFTYGMAAGVARLKAASLENHSLCTLDTLLEVAAETGRIAPADIARIKRFRDDPQSDAWMKG